MGEHRGMMIRLSGLWLLLLLFLGCEGGALRYEPKAPAAETEKPSRPWKVLETVKGHVDAKAKLVGRLCGTRSSGEVLDEITETAVILRPSRPIPFPKPPRNHVEH